ncbi:hypothetical protein BH10PSE9_BH10PSE9_24980 [soil metagenome]
MSDTSDNTSSGNVRSLRDTIRKVRTAETERQDVVVELRDAERARLELRAEELRSVFAEVPPEDDQFVFSVAPGTPPRLWIDMTAFVVMGRDRRTYRFLKDTRLGRTVIVESAKLADLADTITHYVAERIIERERAIEGDWLIKRVMRDEATRRQEAREVATAVGQVAATGVVAAPAPKFDPRNVGWIVAAFLGGTLLGMIFLLAYAWVKVG